MEPHLSERAKRVTFFSDFKRLKNINRQAFRVGAGGRETLEEKLIEVVVSRREFRTALPNG